MKNLITLFTLTIAAVLLLFRPVYGYLDPASGSYFLQILLASLLAALFALKLYWRRIRTFLAGLFSKKEKAKSDES